MRRLAAVTCLAVVAAADYVIARREPTWFQVGLVDEPAHVATALLLSRGRPSAAYLIGSVLPDVDHIPLAFRNPKPGDPRPRTHSFIAVVPAALISRPLAEGIAAHLLRDTAMPPGIQGVRIPYAAYALILLATAYSRSRPW